MDRGLLCLKAVLSGPLLAAQPTSSVIRNKSAHLVIVEVIFKLIYFLICAISLSI